MILKRIATSFAATVVAAATVLSMAGAVVPARASAGDIPFPDIPIPDIPGIPKPGEPGSPFPAPPAPPAPKYDLASIYPRQNSTMGVAQPVIIRFNAVPKDRASVLKNIKVEVFSNSKDNPEQYDIRGHFRWWGDKELRWRPAKFWPAHSTVRVTVGKDVRVFRVGARKVAVADNNTKMIKVYIDEKLVRTVPVSMGKTRHETPNGFYYIGDKHRHIVMDSSTYGVPVNDPEGYKVDVEYALRMTYSGIFLHAAPWSVYAQGNTNVSHGCLNVSQENGKWFFDSWNGGDVIRVINSVGTLSPADGMGDWAPGAY